MRVGVYIDGFNLYYGGRELCGRNAAGWRWLDLRGLASSLVAASNLWPVARHVHRIVYCTARVNQKEDPSAFARQDAYLRALVGSVSVDWIEYGNYVNRVKYAPLATPDKNGGPVLTSSNWPVMVRDAATNPVQHATFLVSYARREEKASDVNVASHLLTDMFTNAIDAAIVISNDSDLRYPIREARNRISVGTVNPSSKQTAGGLKGQPGDGVGGHWWYRLLAADFTNHQLPDPAAGHNKPAIW